MDSKERATDWTGKNLLHYRILEKLGAGGMGEVYRAHDTSKLDRDVALKVMPPDLAADAQLRNRFEREAAAIAALNHPNIVTVHSIQESQGTHFITMELVQGGTLADSLPPDGWALERFFDIAIPLTDAIATAHAKGIAHRDLKPANVMLDAAGRVKILDFGLAKLVATDLESAPTAGLDSDTQAGAILGTVSYMSPEQAQGQSIDHRTDVFSLGIILYEMLCGQHPFRGETHAATIAALLRDEPPHLMEIQPSLPSPLARMIHRCLEKNAERRYQSLLDLRNDLSELHDEWKAPHLSKSPSMLDATHTADVQRRDARSRRALWIAAVVLIVALTAIVAPELLRRDAEDVQPVGSQTSPANPGRTRWSLKQVTFGTGVEEYPAFSPDGLRLAYSKEVGDYRQIVVLDLESGAERPLTSAEHDHIQATWSADAKHLLYVRGREARSKLEPDDVFGVHSGGDIWAHELASDKTRILIRDASNPAVSPDGTAIAFDAAWGGARHIWVSDDQGRNARQVTVGMSEGESHIVPRWSPDGARIVFQSIESTKFDIGMVDLATQTKTAITDDAFRDLNPVWSTAGQEIFFSSYRSGGMNIWRIPLHPDGAPAGPAQPLTTGAGQDVQLVATADGTRMAMTILNINADIWRMPVAPETGLPRAAPHR